MNNIWALAGIVVKELYRRKDFYVLFILTALITLVLGSVNFFNDDRIVRYLKELCLLLVWICALVIAVTAAARQIPTEKENRTIFPLLAKPVSRWELVFGKFFGCWFASALVLLFFYIFFVVISGAREHVWPIENYIQALWLHWIFLGVVIAIALLGSVVFSSVSANVTICFILVTGILLLGRHLNKIAMQLTEPGSTIVSAVYFAIPHLEFFDLRDLIIHNLPFAPWSVVGLATIYGAVYTLLFLVATWLIFRRKGLA